MTCHVPQSGEGLHARHKSISEDWCSLYSIKRSGKHFECFQMDQATAPQWKRLNCVGADEASDTIAQVASWIEYTWQGLSITVWLTNETSDTDVALMRHQTSTDVCGNG